MSGPTGYVAKWVYHVLKSTTPLCCLFPALWIFLSNPVLAQQDTLRPVLKEVTITAYNQDKQPWNTPAPVSRIDNRLLQNLAQQSALQAINAIPGVRMEERSPGSYRLNIRGSSMRAPFGVRNVKVYYNDIPFTEPGGTSYINQLGQRNFSNAEIAKGPGSSMYGAGTGGVVLLQYRQPDSNMVEAGYGFGSFGTHSFFADIVVANDRSNQHIGYQQAITQGYRQQSKVNRAIFNWDATYRFSEKHQLQTTFLYGDLSYQTPGALTGAEFEQEPEASRPAAGAFPSARDARAAIHQQTVLIGGTLKSEISHWLTNKSTAYTAFTGLDNAAIRNYSYLQQPHSGARTTFVLSWDFDQLRLRGIAGGEFQAGTAALSVYDNDSGVPSSMQKEEQVRTIQWMGFAQFSLGFRGWELLMASGLNNLAFQYEQYFPASVADQRQVYTAIFTPRLSLSKEVANRYFIFAALSRGYSPPTTDELLPSGSQFNRTLRPEDGWNYELGFRYRKARTLLAELNGYLFRLNNTIVQRRDAGGGDNYLNAGNTVQPGIELSLQYLPALPFEGKAVFSAAYAYQPYTYGTFVRENEDYSGNRLPGVAEHNFFANALLDYRGNWMLQANYTYNSPLALNDANAASGGEVHLLSATAGYAIQAHRYKIRLSLGIDNALNLRYSLGYDINAAAGRYYNAAPPRNYFLQLILARR